MSETPYVFVLTYKCQQCGEIFTKLAHNLEHHGAPFMAAYSDLAYRVAAHKCEVCSPNDWAAVGIALLIGIRREGNY